MIQNGRLSGSKVIKLVHPSKSISWSKKSSSQIYPMVSCNVNLSYSIMISLHPQATNGPQEAIRLSHHCALCSWGFAHACGPTLNAPLKNRDDHRAGALAARQAMEVMERRPEIYSAKEQVGLGQGIGGVDLWQSASPI